jgi:hypothetical protein
MLKVEKYMYMSPKHWQYILTTGKCQVERTSDGQKLKPKSKDTLPRSVMMRPFCLLIKIFVGRLVFVSYLQTSHLSV